MTRLQLTVHHLQLLRSGQGEPVELEDFGVHRAGQGGQRERRLPEHLLHLGILRNYLSPSTVKHVQHAITRIVRCRYIIDGIQARRDHTYPYKIPRFSSLPANTDSIWICSQRPVVCVCDKMNSNYNTHYHTTNTHTHVPSHQSIEEQLQIQYCSIISIYYNH